MVQILVPVADQATGLWTTTPLWSKVDDDSTVGPDNIEIVSADNTSPDNADFQLAAGTDPSLSTGHILRANWFKNAASGHIINAILELWQGIPGTGTLIAALTVNNIVNAGTSTYTLSGAEADSITDYSNLYLRLSRQGETGGPQSGRRSLVADFVELEIPDAGAGGSPQTIAVTASTETETAQPVAALAGAVFVAVDPAIENEPSHASPVIPNVSEVEVARTVTPSVAGGAQVIAVDPAIENEPSHPSPLIPAAAEAEAAQTVSPATAGTPQTVAVVHAIEQESETRALIAREVETAQSVTPLLGGSSEPVLAASESETAQTVTALTVTTVTVGAVLETEAAQTVGATAGLVSVVVGEATESEEARIVGASQASAPQSRPVGVVSETEVAGTVVTVPGIRIITVGVTSESEAVQTVSALPGVVSVAVGEALESEQARIVGANQAAAPQSRPVGLVTETETAETVTFQSTVTVTVSAASETESSEPVAFLRSLDFARPDADLDQADWESAPTPGQDLYAQIDEETIDDNDYIFVGVS